MAYKFNDELEYNVGNGKIVLLYNNDVVGEESYTDLSSSQGIGNKIIELLEDIKQSLENERDFNKTINILKPLDDEVLREALIWLAIDSQNMSYYFLILQLIQENETWTHHLTASRLLSVSLVSFEGAENIALNHLRRAIELDNDNVELKLELVSFFESPEKLVSEEEVKFIIKNYYRFASKDLQERIDNIVKRRNWESNNLF